MLRFQRRQFSVYRVLLASFLSILVLSAAAQLVVALKSNQILTSELERANDASLEVLRISFDDTFTVLQEWCSEISLDTQINSLIAMQEDRRSPQTAYLNAQVVKRLSEVRFASSYVGGLYLYMLKDDYVLTPEGKYSAEEYFETFFGNAGSFSLEEWRQMHTSSSFSQYETMSVDASGNERKSFLLCALPVGAASQRSAVLGMELSIQSLNRVVTNGQWLSDMYVGIVDHMGNIISLGSAEAESLLRHVRLREGGMHMEPQQIDGRDFFVTDIASAVNSWRYVSLIPQSTYLRSRNTLLTVFALVVGITLALGLCLSFALARMHYTPVQRLVRMVGTPKTSGPARRYENEYAMLERSIQSVKRENWALNRLNSGREEALRQRFLTALLQGTLADVYEIEGVLRECGMRLQKPGFALIVFGFEGGKPQTDGWFKTLEGAVKAHFLCAFDAVYVRMESEACVILNEDMDVRARVQTSLQEVLRACEQAGLGQLAACVSAAHADASGIHAAYLESSELLEYVRLMGLSEVCFYEDLPDRGEEYAVNLMIQEGKLANLLRAGQYPQAQKVFNEMLDETFRVGGMSIQAMKCNLYGLIYSLSRIVGTPQSPEQLPILEKLRPVERLMVCQNVTDLRREMNALLLEMDAGAGAPPHVEGMELIDGATAFIQAHQAQQDLSVAMVAEAMGVTPVHITRVFQRLLGMGTLDYIHHTRLKTAKQMLSISSRSIREIAELTGYNNSVTFIRVFKKYEGITPGQYRENEQQQ